MGREIDVQAETCGKLLTAAGEVFAERGFVGATIREICRRAGANVAAVNYHFGDKGNLYAAVLRHAHARALEDFPGEAGEGRVAPDIRLRAFVTWFLRRCLGEGEPSWHGKLMAREMIEPTPALDDLVRSDILPLFEVVESACRELMGPGVPVQTARFAARSVVGQCLYYRQSRAMIDRLHPEDRFGPDQLGALAHHIAEFSLGGLQRLAEDARQPLGGASPP